MTGKVKMACAVGDTGESGECDSSRCPSLENGVSCDSTLVEEMELMNGVLDNNSEENDEVLVLKPNRKLMTTAVADDGDYQGPHDWRKQLKPVKCTTSERPGSGRSGSGRDFTIVNGYEKKLKNLDAKMKFRDGDKNIERFVNTKEK